MPDGIFYFMLNMSLAACLVIVVLLIVRLIRPLPARFVYPLWALAFFRLVIPFTLSTNWSLFNLSGALVKRLVTVETITQGALDTPVPSGWAAMNFIGAAESYAPIAYKTSSLRSIFTIGTAIWMVVALALIFLMLVLYTLTRVELAKAVRVRDNIYRSDMLLSPVIIGLARPKVILPATLDIDSPEGKMVLAHETVHRRRLDNLWRMIAIIIACCHWFNPLVWVMLKAFFTDMERSCDESVLRTGSFSQEEKKIYARALLRFSADRRIYVTPAFGHSGVKVRVMNVLNFKRMTIIGVILSTLFLLAVVLVLITNPSLGG